MDWIAEQYDTKAVLITGGLGFIGSNLAHRLASYSHAEIRLLDSLHPGCGGNPRNLDGITRPAQVHTFDMRDSSRLPELVCGVDVIFNLCGQVSHIDSMCDPVQDLRSNAEAHLSLLNTCRSWNPSARIIFSSTRQCYGRPEYLPVDEAHPVSPVDINGINKYAAESYHRMYEAVYGLQTCSLRLTNTYGPRQLIKHARQGFIAWFIHQILCDDEIVLFGDGQQVRDLTYVDCVVDALLVSGCSPCVSGRVYNVGSGVPVRLIELVETMIRISGKGRYRLAPFPEDRRKIDIGSYYSDNSRITRDLGWQPRVALEDGLARTLQFFENRRSAYLA
jgi:UDP-glucose 4-epimerase